jgi:hypothetical protein
MHNLFRKHLPLFMHATHIKALGIHSLHLRLLGSFVTSRFNALTVGQGPCDYGVGTGPLLRCYLVASINDPVIVHSRFLCA